MLVNQPDRLSLFLVTSSSCTGPAQDELQLQCDSLLQRGGDALVMSISTRALEGKINGAWCDAGKTYEGFYICEGVI